MSNFLNCFFLDINREVFLLTCITEELSSAINKKASLIERCHLFCALCPMFKELEYDKIHLTLKLVI